MWCKYLYVKQLQRLRIGNQLCKIWRAVFISGVVMKVALFDVISRMYVAEIFALSNILV